MMRLAPICEGNANNNNNQLLLFLFIVTFAIISTTFTEHSFNPSSRRRNCKCISSHKVQVWKVVRMITPVIQSFNLHLIAHRQNETMVLPCVSITRKWEVFGFSLLSENHGILDNSDFAVFVDPVTPLFFRPLFLGHCFDFPIQELLQQSTIPTPRNTECSALL